MVPQFACNPDVAVILGALLALAVFVGVVSAISLTDRYHRWRGSDEFWKKSKSSYR